MSESADERAERLAAVASELVLRVRDDDPVANERWLHAVLPHHLDREALLYVLAAAVPDDRSWKALTAWTVVATPLDRELLAERFGPVMPADLPRRSVA